MSRYETWMLLRDWFTALETLDICTASHGFAWLRMASRLRPATGPNLCSRWEIFGNRWNIYGKSVENLWETCGHLWKPMDPMVFLWKSMVKS